MGRSIAILALSAALLTGGCDLPQAGNMAADTADEFTRSDKLRSYTAAVSSIDLPELLRLYETNKIETKSDADRIFVPAGQISYLVRDMRDARAKPGRISALDDAADKAMPVFDRLLVRLQGLDSYYTTRAYRADDWARGQREHPLLIAEFRAAIAVAGPFDAALRDAQKKAVEDHVERFRREGNMSAYYDTAIALKAIALAGEIASPSAAGDPARAVRGDRIVTELTPLIEQARKARAADAAKRKAFI